MFVSRTGTEICCIMQEVPVQGASCSRGACLRRHAKPKKRLQSRFLDSQGRLCHDLRCSGLLKCSKKDDAAAAADHEFCLSLEFVRRSDDLNLEEVFQTMPKKEHTRVWTRLLEVVTPIVEEGRFLYQDEEEVRVPARAFFVCVAVALASLLAYSVLLSCVCFSSESRCETHKHTNHTCSCSASRKPSPFDW